MLELTGIRKTWRRRGEVTVALDEVSARVTAGRTLGVIGESGSGKSTLARIALRLLDPDAGRVVWDGQDITRATGRGLRAFRRAVQPVFQDAAGALDPRLTVRQCLTEPLRLRGDVPGAEVEDRIAAALRRVDLDPALAARPPRALSGGQRQRVGIARALLMEPRALILDEPVSALDVSVQAHVLNLLRDLQEAQGLGYLFIGHDLAVAEYFCDDLIVLQAGVVQEAGPVEQVLGAPRSAYTRALLAAVPRSL